MWLAAPSTRTKPKGEHLGLSPKAAVCVRSWAVGSSRTQRVAGVVVGGGVQSESHAKGCLVYSRSKKKLTGHALKMLPNM